MPDGLLSLYSDVEAVPVKWIWYPYIPRGKITLLQGDPGDGKSTMMMDIIARITTGGIAPDGTHFGLPQKAIYQCSEDNAADTIKPRLLQCKADCSKVAFLDEEKTGSITLNDERLRDALQSFQPSLLVIDPIQSYMGSDNDLQIVGKARRILQRLSLWATAYDCAVVLIGHLNKKESQKSLYRGLGSIDIAATARSVLQVERDAENVSLRHVTQVKNNLGPFGNALHFEINPTTGFLWRNDLITQVSEEKVNTNLPLLTSQSEKAAQIIKQCLQSEDRLSDDMKAMLRNEGISRRMIDNIKKHLGIRSYRVMRKWYWSLTPKDKDKS